MLKRQAGFSFVELLVGMGISAFIIAGALAMFASINTTTDSVVKTGTMQQELREIGLVMTRDIRRAGYSGVQPGQDYNGDGMPTVSQTGTARANSIQADILFNPYLTTSADIRVFNAAGGNDCLLFTYNLDDDLPGTGVAAAVESNEWFGYRRQVVGGRGVVQMKTAGSAPTGCTSEGTWETISSDNVDVSALSFSMVTDEVEIENLSGGTSDLCEEGDSCVCIRTVDFNLSVALARDSSVTAALTDSLRIRNDKMVPVRSAAAHCYD